MALLPRLVRREALAIDVGAKVGAYTRRLLPLVAGVHAFEPNPRLARFLVRTLPAGAMVHALALGDTTGRTVLRVPRDAEGRAHPGRATIAPGNDFAALPGASAIALPVPVARLDDLEGLGPVGFIKIDVEGHERAVIAGGAALIARDRPRLLVEANAAHGGAPDLLLRDLAALDYRPFVLADGRLKPLAGPAPGENLVFVAVGDRV